MRTLYLFGDTNLFMQCRPLEELDWERWHEWDEVCLVVSRPVQHEIDAHKNKGGERVARRARKASTLFREIILNAEGIKIIRASKPAVKLSIRAEILPDKSLADTLNYNTQDDCLVGCAYSFKNNNDGIDVRILTHDTGPMATAKMVGLSVYPIPDDWLLPPEPTESNKRVSALEEELLRLKKQEPQLRVKCVNEIGSELDELNLEVFVCEELQDSEISQLIEELKDWSPVNEDFGPAYSYEREANGIMRCIGEKEVYTPVSAERIARYQQEYSEWIKECEDRLRKIHTAISVDQQFPTFRFLAENCGTRPASDALITIMAHGQFCVCPPLNKLSKGRNKGVEPLSVPPSVPLGKWSIASLPELTSLGALDELRRAQLLGSNFAGLSSDFDKPFPSLLTQIPKSRDPNAFYYKDRRLEHPHAGFSLECKQWRHGGAAEMFSGLVLPNQKQGEITGALEIKIEAENLSQGIVKHIPLSLHVKCADTIQLAKNLIATSPKR